MFSVACPSLDLDVLVLGLISVDVQVSCQVGYRRLLIFCKAQLFKSSFTVFDDLLHKKEKFNTNIKKKDAHTYMYMYPGTLE